MPRVALALLTCACMWLVSPGCSDLASRGQRLNVALIVLDAARADHFGTYGYGRPTTPAADAFARNATRYEMVISEAPFTFLAMSSLLSGGSPAVTGLAGRSGGIVPDDLELVPETARECGFLTLAYSENPYVTRYFGLDQGFEFFEEAFPVSLHVQGSELDPDLDSAARLTASLDRATARPDRPFFLYAHLLRPHNPYAPPAPFAGRFGSDPRRRSEGSSASLVEMDARGEPFDPERLEQVVALYDENLAYADALFGRFLANLEARGLAERTIVILTADHGEAFGEHGRLLHSTQLYDPMLRVPLIVRVPGESPRIERAPIQLADLGRGLRAYFHGEPGARAALTQLGRGRPESDPLYSWTNAKTHLVSARTQRRKLVIDAATLDVVAYHDLEADPAEQHPRPLDAMGESLVPGLTARIAEWAGLPRRIESPSSIDPRVRQQLEALGYLDANDGG